MNKKLKEAYNPERFQDVGNQLVEILSSYLKSCFTNEDKKVIKWQSQENQLNYWKVYQNNDPIKFFSDILENSIHLHNPKYMGHQVVPPLPIASLASFLGSMLNNGMATYDSGPASTSIEKSIIEIFNKEIGFDSESDGFLTSGGTIASLTALLCARQTKSDKDIWDKGLDENLAIMVSDEAHYSIDRAVRIMGFGSKGIIKIPVDRNYMMNTDLLEEYYQDSKNRGIKVIAVVGSAPSTSTGVYDNLSKIGDFCKENDLWFHVDGAHGGAAIFSKKYKYLLSGIEKADSIIIDAHKMLLTPSLTTVLLFKDGNNSYSTFRQKAQFLWDYSHEMEWYNSAQRTIECTKYMMSIRLFSIFQFHGKSIFDDYVTTMYDLAKVFSILLKNDPNFEIAIEPVSNIVCLRYILRNLSKSKISELNENIRKKIIEDGEFHIVETILNNETYLRTTLMNPFTEKKHLLQLINKIKEFA